MAFTESLPFHFSVKTDPSFCITQHCIKRGLLSEIVGMLSAWGFGFDRQPSGSVQFDVRANNRVRERAHKTSLNTRLL